MTTNHITHLSLAISKYAMAKSFGRAKNRFNIPDLVTVKLSSRRAASHEA